MEIKIAPNVISDDITQEELDEVLEEMQKMVDSNTLFENSIPVDMDKLQKEDPALYELLIQRVEEIQVH